MILHDIICMSNNLSNRTAYIIIGIDEQQDYSIVDVSCDPNRKNTQKLVDFLKDKNLRVEYVPLYMLKVFTTATE